MRLTHVFMSFSMFLASSVVIAQCDKSMVATSPCGGVDTTCNLDCSGQPGGTYAYHSNATVYMVGFSPGTLKTAGSRDVNCVSSCQCRTAVIEYARCDPPTKGCKSTGPLFNQSCLTGENCVPVWSTQSDTMFQSCVGS